jgi:hypothetical protein
VRACGQCGGPVERRYRFCPWCAAPQRLKIVDFFRAHPGIKQDRGKALRVSRYLGALDERHTRFSVWDESGRTARATAAVSLDDEEAARLARFLADTEPTLSETEAPADSTIH